MRNQETSPLPLPENALNPDLNKFLLHNQAQWRRRTRGLGAFSSPIEIKPSAWFLGSDTLQRVMDTFGVYIRPEHKKNPPLLGISVFTDLPVAEMAGSYWIAKSPYLNDATVDFNEAKVRWLTAVAIGENPSSPNFMTKHGMPTSIREEYVHFISACGNGLSSEKITEAFAKHHFEGNNQQLDEIFPQLFPENKQTFTEYILQKYEESEEVHNAEQPQQFQQLKPEVSPTVMKATIAGAKTMAQLIRTNLFQEGSTSVPGIINLELKSDILLFGGALCLEALETNANLSQWLVYSQLLVAASALATQEIALLFHKKRNVVHELIHATGITETSDQGFPATWVKKNIFGFADLY
jgi:hypothetical protein